jgi:hypothetical protein
MKQNMRKIIKTGIIATIFLLTFNINLEWIGSPIQKTVIKNTGIETVSLSSDLFIQTAYAEEPTTVVTTRVPTPQMLQKAADTASYIHHVFYPLINFFAFHTGNFLGNDYIFEGKMGEMLNKIWVVSRNIVNIVFVIILLYFALKQIIPGKEAEGGVKGKLINIALLLIAVNFSWLATKVVLDAANVTTNIAFSLPSGVASTGIEKIMDQPCQVNPEVTQPDGSKKKMYNTTAGGCMPTNTYYVTPSGDEEKVQYLKEEDCKSQGIAKAYQGDPKSAFTANGERSALTDTDPNKKYQGITTYCWDNINFFNYNKNTSTIYLVYGMGQIQKVVNASADTGSATQLFVGGLLSLFIQAAYTLSLMALFIALIFRMAMLWIFVAFSPFLVLIIAFQGKAPTEISNKFSIKAFLDWAFVPTYVGAVFSVAFIMLAAGQAAGKVGTSTINYGANFFNGQSIFSGLDTIQEFIWLLLVLVILWMGVFQVLSSKVPFVGMVTDKIKTMGTSAATTIGKSPLSLPLAPMTDDKGGFRMGAIKELGSRSKFKEAGEMEDKYKGYITGNDLTLATDRAKNMSPGERKNIADLAAAGKMEQVAEKFKVSVEQLRTNQTIFSLDGGFVSEQTEKIRKGFDEYDKNKAKTAQVAPPAAGTGGTAMSGKD